MRRESEKRRVGKTVERYRGGHAGFRRRNERVVYRGWVCKQNHPGVFVFCGVFKSGKVGLCARCPDDDGVHGKLAQTGKHGVGVFGRRIVAGVQDRTRHVIWQCVGFVSRREFGFVDGLSDIYESGVRSRGSGLLFFRKKRIYNNTAGCDDHNQQNGKYCGEGFFIHGTE